MQRYISNLRLEAENLEKTVDMMNHYIDLLERAKALAKEIVIESEKIKIDFSVDEKQED